MSLATRGLPLIHPAVSPIPLIHPAVSPIPVAG
jgi:hypothetical protein